MKVIAGTITSSPGLEIRREQREAQRIEAARDADAVASCRSKRANASSNSRDRPGRS